MRLHFSIGGTQNEDLQSIRDLEGNDNEFNWTVPKDAEIGDKIFLIVPYISGPIRARGTIESELEWTTDFGGRYRAWIQIERLEIPVHLTDLQNAFPDIDYFKKPLAPYTIRQKDTAAVIQFVERYQHEMAEIWRLGDQLSMRSDETLADSILEVDERKRIAASIVVRRGQRAFREDLLVAYERKCAFSEVALKDVLEAAHIRPYLGEKSNDVTNGLLLRADLHTLFDLGLIGVNPETWNIILSARVSEIPVYRHLATKKLRLPIREEFHPNRASLAEHLKKLR